MKLLVTGGTGFIGEPLVKRLSSAHQVFEVSRRAGLKVDLTSSDLARDLPPVDVVIHLAASLEHGKVFQHAGTLYDANFRMTNNLLDWAGQTGVKRFVFASSYVYGLPQYSPLDELHPLQALNPYMHSKILCESLIEHYSRWFGISSLALRIFNAYGPRQGKDLLVPTLMRQVKAGRVVLKDPKPRRDYVYIDDIVDAFSKAVSAKTEGCEAINIGSGRSYSVSEVVEHTLRELPVKVPVHYEMIERRDEIPNTVAKIDKARELLGWEPRVTLQEGLGRLVKVLLDRDHPA